jgi:D-alanyl-D-alanine dipeptidase
MTTVEREVVLLSDARIGAIPVVESADPLAHLGAFRELSVEKRAPVPPLDIRRHSLGPVHALVREGLADRLRLAARRLPPDVRLHIVEGYRPPALQRAYFEAYRARLLREDAGLGIDASHALASRFVAPPEVAAHPSGAAVDLTLVDCDGQALDMGTDIDATPEESRGACYFDASNISRDARANRQLLADALGPEGLVNYPTEWWHWSYGDRYWAFATGHEAAIYGPFETVQDADNGPGAARRRGRWRGSREGT